MEKEFYNDEFEQLLKEKADQFRMYPSKRVWHSIYNNLHPSRRWPSMVILLLLITSLSFIGYLNTGENSFTRPINNSISTNGSNDIIISDNTDNSDQTADVTKKQQRPQNQFNNPFGNNINNENDHNTYTVVESNRPANQNQVAKRAEEVKLIPEKGNPDINIPDILQTVDSYIKSNKIFADIAVNNKKIKTEKAKSANKNPDKAVSENEIDITLSTKPDIIQNQKTDVARLTDKEKAAFKKLSATEPGQVLSNEEKAWIENYVLVSSSSKTKLKDRLSYQFYVTPAVNYRKLSSKTKGSTTAFASADINAVISQKPGFGLEAGAGISYKIGNRLLLKTGLQLNYTNYNIEADQTNHPIITTILLNDPTTGYSYPAARTSTTTNAFNTSALQPVTLHNRTYQVSIPLGFAYKLSSEKNVDWFAGASLQPTYVFGGNAHIISSDLKSYISDPSSIRTWNLNLGFETYMNFKLGSYDLQLGPQVRYQVYSTYRKDVALIEKPYAIGLKLGLTKGF